MGAAVTSGLHMIDRAMRGFAICGLALVLLLRVLVPAGWMPAQSGGFAVTLCIDGARVAAWIDGDGRVHRVDTGKADKDMPGKDSPCAFAATGLPPLPALAAVVAERIAAVLLLPPLPTFAVAIGRGLAAPPPPATGPPATF